MRSDSIPPKTIAPRRPFPIGRASVHALAGCLYHNTFVDSGGDAVRATRATGRTDEQNRRNRIVRFMLRKLKEGSKFDKLLLATRKAAGVSPEQLHFQPTSTRIQTAESSGRQPEAASLSTYIHTHPNRGKLRASALSSFTFNPHPPASKPRKAPG